jgi:hypothetical protein
MLAFFFQLVAQVWAAHVASVVVVIEVVALVVTVVVTVFVQMPPACEMSQHIVLP